MRKTSTIFLQIVIIAIAIVVLAFLIRFPMTEGRAVNLDLLSIYSDPFILFGYLASIPFFVGLYQAFKLLGNIGQNKIFSAGSVKALRVIKYCAIIQSVFIVMAAVYIRIFHAKDDDPAGFLALCIVATFICVVIASAAAMFGRTLQNAVDLKSENDLTV